MIMEDLQTNNKTSTWQHFKRNKPALISFYILIVLVIIAVISPILANQKPIYIKYKDSAYFPLFTMNNCYDIKDLKTGNIERIQVDICDWKHLKYDQILFPPIAYSPNAEDYSNINYKSPFDNQEFLNSNQELEPMPLRYRHFLGTNKKGDDLFAGIIHGTGTALTIGLFSMLIAAFFGILLGSLAGYFGDKDLTITRGALIGLSIGFLLAFYYAFIKRFFTLEDALANSSGSFLLQLVMSMAIFSSISFGLYFIGKNSLNTATLKSEIHIPIDSIITKTIEILLSIPQILLCQALA